mgnify:CR=1 FL=1
MDIKRTILIVALAIVTYVGVLKWNQDYGQAALPTQNVAASTNNAALPDTPQGTTAANADVPSATGEVAAPADAPVAASKDLIQVKTDVLNLEIDPVGGDVTQAALRAMAFRGRLVVIGYASGDIPAIPTNYLLLKNIAVLGLQLADFRHSLPDDVAAALLLPTHISTRFATLIRPGQPHRQSAARYA